MMINVLYRDKAFIFGVSIWLIATAAYFGFVSMGFPLSPIAENGLMSLVTIYLPVLLLSVFLLIYLTRKRDIWIIVAYWALDFFGSILAGATDFFGGISASQYAKGIPWGILINALGAGLPVVVMMHIIFIPRMAVLFKNKLTVILMGGLFYSVFSLFDQGVDYSSLSIGLTSITYIIMTQTLVGMGKATFTVITGNPFIHFITLHVISARVPFDTRMYIEIFKLK